jgi:2-phosphoglycerate kinase
MIYLIGGPPKCGKTTLAKALSKSLEIPWFSTDTLQCVIKPYISKEDHAIKFPVSYQRCKDNDEKYSKYSKEEIIDAYRKQAKTVYLAIDMFAVCEITDGNDFIIEGYHVEPELVKELCSKYPGKIKSIFLVKTDKQKFINDIKKSSTPNDWIIRRTHNEKTFKKIADMVCEYGKFFKKESENFGFDAISMDDNFESQIKNAVESMKIV